MGCGTRVYDRFGRWGKKTLIRITWLNNGCNRIRRRWCLWWFLTHLKFSKVIRKNGNRLLDHFTSGSYLNELRSLTLIIQQLSEVTFHMIRIAIVVQNNLLRIRSLIIITSSLNIGAHPLSNTGDIIFTNKSIIGLTIDELDWECYIRRTQIIASTTFA